jgi:hypothetical protein
LYSDQARFFAVVFGILGLVLMLGTAVVCFGSLNAPVRAQIPQAAKTCAEELVELLEDGDLAAVSEKLYGNPKLGVDQTLSGEAAAVWEIICEGISCELASEVYVSGSSFSVDAVMVVPDIADITDTVTDHAKAILDERIAVAEKMDELYDENNEFRQDVIDQVMTEAVKLSLAEEVETETKNFGKTSYVRYSLEDENE